MYEQVITDIADNVSKDDMIYSIVNKINMLCSGSLNYKDFIVTKSVGSVGDKTPERYFDEKGEKKQKLEIIPFLAYLENRI